MNAATLLQLAFLLAAFAALFVMVNAKGSRRARAAQSIFGVFLACSMLTQVVSAQERARAEVVEKVSQLDELAGVELPSDLKREGRKLMTSSIERALGHGLGRPNLALLLAGGVLLGMSLGQLLALRRSQDAPLAEQPA